MEPTSWVKNQLGVVSKDEEFDPMNPDHFSDRELKESQIKLQQDTKKLQQNIDSVEKERRDIIEKAVGKNKWEKKRLAMQADTLLKKGKILQRRYIVKQRYLTLVTIIQQMREMLADVEGDMSLSKIEKLIQSGELDASEVGTMVQDRMLNLGVDLSVVEDVIEELDIDIILPDIDTEMGDSESLGLIEKLEQGELERDELDMHLKEQHNEESDDVSGGRGETGLDPDMLDDYGMDSLDGL